MKKKKIEEVFTKKEISALKEVAKDIIHVRNIMGDAEYRNKFEYWGDDYANIQAIGFTHEEIIKRIGKKK